jgi:flagellar protein FliO/FliZ
MEVEGYFRFILALIFVLALIGVFGLLARRFGLGFPTPGKKGKGRRLSVIEVMTIDPKRRLVLCRRDDTEHLILVGGGADVVIEGNIPARPFSEVLNDSVGGVSSRPGPGAEDSR